MTTNIITATLTAYCSCKLCCGPHASNRTASNETPTQGITIAASRTIPFGSTVIIAGHIYKVQDRLARRYDKRFDIYFRSHEAARNFGIKTNQTVMVITK